MSQSSRGGIPVVGILIAIVGGLLISSMSGNTHLKSPDETNQVMSQLGLKWRHPGAPVIVLVTPG